jgi:putative transposase
MTGIYHELHAVMSHRAAARLTGVSRASAHRATVIGPKRPRRPGRPPVNRLDEAERATILAVLNSDRFVDTTPIEVFATLLDEGVYLASISTFYRVLRENKQVKERQFLRGAKRPPPGTIRSWFTRHGPILRYRSFELVDRHQKDPLSPRAGYR